MRKRGLYIHVNCDVNEGKRKNANVKSKKFYKRGSMEGTEWDCNPIERTTISTNQTALVLPGTKTPTKECTWRDPCLQLHM